jgi:hypothetical protein
MLGWSSSLQLRSLIVRGEVTRVEGQLNAKTNEYNVAVNNQKKLVESRKKIAALHQLTVSRFLQGNLLNALQQTTLDDVTLRRFRLDQAYSASPEGKASTNELNQVIPAKAANSSEQIVLTLDATDSGINTGDQVSKFKQALAVSPFFVKMLTNANQMRLTSLSPPAPTQTGKQAVSFTLECRFPEKTRL